jgi:hypothetical protein
MKERTDSGGPLKFQFKDGRMGSQLASGPSKAIQRVRRRFMLRVTLAVFLGVCLAHGQQEHTPQDHHATVNEHGDKVMGFAHDKTTHHFVLTQDGGLIEVRVNDSKDAASLDQIRNHFQHIVRMFADGNFNAPMLVHSQDIPGTTIMTRLKTDLHWELQEIPRGSRITITADNKEALDAVHDFLRFQIGDHQTGDCTAIR